ncbi:MAG: transglycosylase domain-containing protein [Gemmatimonadota bacterium]|nr:transglycosylase domain-containing protein [Gemmatimonadota bacterium]
MHSPAQSDGTLAADTRKIAQVETREAPPPPRREKLRRTATRIGKPILAVLAGYYVLCVLLLVVYRFVEPPVTAVQLQRRVESWIARRDYREKKRYVAYSRVPARVSRAVVAAEDGRFWRHSGFDLAEMRAASTEIFDGELPRGASTITQQLVKNLFGCACRNPVRKIFDMALTPPAELILGKERILELYLNNAEWGPGVFGIEAAARHHFGTSAGGLSRTQAAGLAALLPNPHRRTTGSTSEYRAEILRRMGRRGW